MNKLANQAVEPMAAVGRRLRVRPPRAAAIAHFRRWANLRVKNLVSMLWAGLLACILVSCATGKDKWPRSGVYRGTAMFGFEHSDFTPDGSREKWWLSGGVKEITDRMGAARPALHNPVLVTLEGDLSEPGRYGHLGQYRRELQVVRVLDVKQADWEVTK